MHNKEDKREKEQAADNREVQDRLENYFGNTMSSVSPFHNLHHSITFRIISFIMILLFFFSCCFHKDSTLKSLCQGISGVSG